MELLALCQAEGGFLGMVYPGYFCSNMGMRTNATLAWEGDPNRIIPFSSFLSEPSHLAAWVQYPAYTVACFLGGCYLHLVFTNY